MTHAHKIHPPRTGGRPQRGLTSTCTSPGNVALSSPRHDVNSPGSGPRVKCARIIMFLRLLPSRTWMSPHAASLLEGSPAGHSSTSATISCEKPSGTNDAEQATQQGSSESGGRTSARVHKSDTSHELSSGSDRRQPEDHQFPIPNPNAGVSAWN